MVLSTGGHTSNVNFRRMFDPRLTEEYQVVGEPYSRQSGDGEIAAMQVGASLWGVACQTVETQARSHIFEKPYVIGNQYGYPQGGGKRNENIRDSPVKGIARGIGLQVADYQNLIQVNQFGRRFVNEFATGFDWWNPCLEQSGVKAEGGGPIWAIFDADGAKREEWTCAPPFVDPDGWFFSAGTMRELASKIVSKYQKEPDARARRSRKRSPGTIPSWTKEKMKTSASLCRCTKFNRRPFMPRGPRPASTIAFPACASMRRRRSSTYGERRFPVFTARGKLRADLISTA